MTHAFIRGANSADGRAEQTSARLCERLRATGYAALANIGCEVVRGEVVLHGVVPTYYLKQLAQTIALDHPGVSRVQNRLHVASRRFDVVLPPDHTSI